MSVAFYAPMKPLDDPRPSGDRTIGRNLFAALDKAERAPFVACRFKSRDGAGDPRRARRLAGTGARLADRLAQRLDRRRPRPRAWFTYHVYYKAPDHLGPQVSAALGVPYLIAEASHAPARLRGPWAAGAAAAAAAIRAADRVLTLNPADAPAIAALRGDGGQIDFPPFLDAAPYAATADAPSRAAARAALSARIGGAPERPIALTVAMMRPGAKQRSYALLAEAWRRMATPPRLAIVGDGPVRAEVEAAFAGVDAAFFGAADAAALPALYAGADLFVWPAIDEAFGMAFLEAQAAGTPVVAGDCGGVAAMLVDRETGFLTPLGDAAAFAAAVEAIAADLDRRSAMGRAAALFAAGRDQTAAAARLDAILTELGS